MRGFCRIRSIKDKFRLDTISRSDVRGFVFVGVGLDLNPKGGFAGFLSFVALNFILILRDEM